MSILYGRKISLVVGTSTGNALDLSQMHITFTTRKAIVGTPNIFEARVWNLSQSTVKKLTAATPQGTPEFNRVVLQAGYASGPYGQIFSGEVRYFRHGRSSPTDTYLDIYAADSDQAHNYATVNVALPPGATQADVANTLNSSLSAQGAASNNAQPPSSGVQYPRGKVMFGPAREYTRQLAANTDSQWSIQDGNQQYVARTAVLPGAPIQINSATGMIGIPVQTIYGIEVTMLLNPNIKFGQLLQINNADIQTATLDLSIAGYAQNSLNQLGSEFLASDGYYKVIAGEYEGDTRGLPWYLKAVCVTADSSTSVAAVQSGWLPGP